MWLLQRHCHAVDNYPTDVPADALVMDAQIEYTPGEPVATVCNVVSDPYVERRCQHPERRCEPERQV